MGLSGRSASKWVQVCNPKSTPKSYPKMKGKKKPKSKLGLPKIIMGLDKSFSQSFRGNSKKVSSMNSNGPPRNYGGVLEVNFKTCTKGTKLRVYKPILIFEN